MISGQRRHEEDGQQLPLMMTPKKKKGLLLMMRGFARMMQHPRSQTATKPSAGAPRQSLAFAGDRL
jgi:hypothetical protein